MFDHSRPLSSCVSPKRPDGCKGGSGHVKGRDQFLGLLVSWFFGFSVSWFLGFLVSKFLGFKVSWFQSCLVYWLQGFQVSMIPYYQNAISCFLEDIDPISEFFKNLLNRSSGFIGTRFPKMFNMCVSRLSEIYQHFNLQNDLGFS